MENMKGINKQLSASKRGYVHASQREIVFLEQCQNLSRKGEDLDILAVFKTKLNGCEMLISNDVKGVKQSFLKDMDSCRKKVWDSR